MHLGLCLAPGVLEDQNTPSDILSGLVTALTAAAMASETPSSSPSTGMDIPVSMSMSPSNNRISYCGTLSSSSTFSSDTNASLFSEINSGNAEWDGIDCDMMDGSSPGAVTPPTPCSPDFPSPIKNAVLANERQEREEKKEMFPLIVYDSDSSSTDSEDDSDDDDDDHNDPFPYSTPNFPSERERQRNPQINRPIYLRPVPCGRRRGDRSTSPSNPAHAFMIPYAVDLSQIRPKSQCQSRLKFIPGSQSEIPRPPHIASHPWQLHCSACNTTHPGFYFSRTERRKKASQRACISKLPPKPRGLSGEYVDDQWDQDVSANRRSGDWILNGEMTRTDSTESTSQVDGEANEERAKEIAKKSELLNSGGFLIDTSVPLLLNFQAQVDPERKTQLVFESRKRWGAPMKGRNSVRATWLHSISLLKKLGHTRIVEDDD